MKFYNPKNKVIYNDIMSAWGAYKCPCPCESCVLLGKCNEEYIKSHVREVVKLMEYEIIEKDEDNFSYLPRLCQILKVKVNQRFYYKHSPEIEFWIGENGGYYHEYVGENNYIDKDTYKDYLIACFRYPENVIKKPIYSQEDIEKIKAIKTLFPDAVTIKKATKELTEIKDKENNNISSIILKYGTDLFPSIQLNSPVSIGEILSNE